MIKTMIPQYDMLERNEQEEVEHQFQTLDMNGIKEVFENVYQNPAPVDMKNITEIPYTTPGELDEHMLREMTLDAMADGQVGVLLMAGGQGTRLEHKGPKGTFSFEGHSLFELQAKQLKAFQEEVNMSVPWYIMTSDINHEETQQFFSTHNHFGLDTDSIHFFRQEHFPALSKEGELLLDADRNIVMTPNGNGGIFSALKNSGMLEHMKRLGIRHVFMNNVDNVVVKVADPLLVGLHIQNDNEVTSKSIEPVTGESVGRLCLLEGQKSVVEYTELPEDQAENFRNGNIGIHVFNIEFLEKAADVKMPYHLALKKMEHLDDELRNIKEEILKFEKFYFDAFQFAETHMTLQVDRTGEFSPLKNKTGKDSVETARRDLMDEGLI